MLACRIRRQLSIVANAASLDIFTPRIELRVDQGRLTLDAPEGVHVPIDGAGGAVHGRRVRVHLAPVLWRVGRAKGDKRMVRPNFGWEPRWGRAKVRGLVAGGELSAKVIGDEEVVDGIMGQWRISNVWERRGIEVIVELGR